MADRGLVRCTHQPHDTDIDTFIKTVLDTRLGNALKDLHAFSCLSNLAYQTTRKLAPATYNEMMVSILYRLTHLSFGNDTVQETVRLGLLVFASTIFLQRQYMEQRYDQLLDLYDRSLLGLRKVTDLDLPAPISLWLTILPQLVGGTVRGVKDWRTEWLDESILRTGTDSWCQACEMLRSICWVDFVHNRSGHQAFESAKFRLQGAGQIDAQYVSL